MLLAPSAIKLAQGFRAFSTASCSQPFVSSRHKSAHQAGILAITCVPYVSIMIHLVHVSDLSQVLIVSFHARFSARIIQGYFQNGKVVIRPSRLINLHTRTVSPEVKLVIRWLNSRPVGDTRLPVQAVPILDHVDDNFDLAIQVTDVLGNLPQDTCERQAIEGTEVVLSSLPTVTLFT